MKPVGKSTVTDFLSTKNLATKHAESREWPGNTLKTFIHTKTAYSSSMVWLARSGADHADCPTIKATRALKECSVWLVDDLVSPEILELASPNTQIVNVAEQSACASTSQDSILRLMARYVREGHTVARLKSGDPSAPGCGGEEMAWLDNRGIRADSVSDLTAASAIANALGLPLTHREILRGVTLVTAHTVDGIRPDWKALAQSGLTIVCYLGMSNIESVTAELLSAGFPTSLPVAVVHRVSRAAGGHITTTLQHLADDVGAHQMANPSVIVLREPVHHQQNVPGIDMSPASLAAG